MLNACKHVLIHRTLYVSIRPSYLNALVTVLEMLIAAGGEGKKIKKIINKKVKNTEIKNLLNSYYDFR